MSQEKILTKHGKRKLQNKAAGVMLAAGIGALGTGVYSAAIDHPKKAKIAEDLGGYLADGARGVVQVTPGEVEELVDAHQTKEDARARSVGLTGTGGFLIIAANSLSQLSKPGQSKDH